MSDIIGNIPGYFEEVGTTKEYNGYWFQIKDILSISILGCLCGLRNIVMIHDWAKSEQMREFFLKQLKIRKIPCYSQFTNILGIIDPKSFNTAFVKWVNEGLKVSADGKTVSFDGKTVRSTNNMSQYDNPLHIVSAYISELGITFGQIAVESKSNEIPAVQELIKLLNISGAIVVADALNCQKKTAETIIQAGGDYILSVKGNQETLHRDIEDFVQDKELIKTMEKTNTKVEKQGGRIEKRTAYVTEKIDWLEGKEYWANIACIGAVNTRFETKEGRSNEWHYYISSQNLSSDDLLKHTRLEWGIESMHWLLDVHFDEDHTRAFNQNTQKNLNIIRKIALNLIRTFKDETNSKKSISGLMRACLFDIKFLQDLMYSVNIPFITKISQN